MCKYGRVPWASDPLEVMEDREASSRFFGEGVTKALTENTAPYGGSGMPDQRDH